MSKKLVYLLSIVLALSLMGASYGAVGSKIVWVGDAHDVANPGTPDDQGWVDLLVAEGYDVDYQKDSPGSGPWRGDLNAEQIEALNSADLVIISRDASTGGHNFPAAWNSITAPMISLSNYMARSSRWQWVNTTAINARQEYYDLKADDPGHPIFTGVPLDPNDDAVWYDAAAGSGFAGFFTASDVGNGRLIASRPDDGAILIAEWDVGVTFYEGTDQAPAADRLLFCAGNQEVGGTNEFFGTYNLSPEGELMFLNAVRYMLGGAKIVLVTEARDNDGDGGFDDQGLVNWLVDEGYIVDVQRDNWTELDADKIAALNAADLIIISRTTGSGSYDDDDEPTLWNSITTPIIQTSAYLLRSSRWKWINSSSAIGQGGAPALEAVDPNHSVLAGVVLDPNNQVQILDPDVGIGHTSFIDSNDVGSGTLIAVTADNGLAWIAEWAPGVEFYEGAGQTPAGYRMMFLAGTQEIEGTLYGALNLTTEGLQMLHNAIASLLAKGIPYIYTYEGDAAVAGEAGDNDSLDGTWDHDNGSDQWDGTGPGEGRPGGAGALVEDDVTFLRIQDTGDPRDYDLGDPGSNRKIYLTHQVQSNLDRTQIEFRIRVATSAPLDDQHPDGGAGVEPWPAEGIAYHVRDGGKGMIGVGEGGLGVISFSLARGGQPGLEDVTGDVLVMNSLVGIDPSGDVDTEDTADTIVAKNWIAVDDITQWNTFTVDIAAGGAGTHIVTVSVNGGPAQAFDVTAGDGTEGEGSYLAMGSSGTGGITAFDVDYLAFKPGVIPEPEPEPEPEPVVTR